MNAEDVPILKIRIFPRESSCVACGEELVDAHQGIPIYEGWVLPDDWEGGDGRAFPLDWGKSWGGFDACSFCFHLQGSLKEPLPLEELSARSERARGMSARIFDEGRAAQGFLDQEHLDAFFRSMDHSQGCQACSEAPQEWMWLEGSASWQPTVPLCPTGKQLFQDFTRYRSLSKT